MDKAEASLKELGEFVKIIRRKLNKKNRELLI